MLYVITPDHLVTPKFHYFQTKSLALRCTTMPDDMQVTNNRDIYKLTSTIKDSHRYSRTQKQTSKLETPTTLSVGKKGQRLSKNETYFRSRRYIALQTDKRCEMPNNYTQNFTAWYFVCFLFLHAMGYVIKYWFKMNRLPSETYALFSSWLFTRYFV